MKKNLLFNFCNLVFLQLAFKFKYFKVIVLLAFMIGFVGNIAYAANIQWDGHTDMNGDGISWDNRFNWVGDAVPGSNDNAIFPSPVGTITVSGTASQAVGSLQAWNGVNLSLNLDVTVASTNGTVVKIFDGSTITVKSGATLTVSISGTNAACVLLDKPNGTFNVEAGGTANLTAWRGIGTSSASTTATVNNYGTMNITATNAAIQPDNASSLTVTNHAGGTINLLDNKIKIWSTGAVSKITNDGFVNYTGTTSPISVTNNPNPTNISINNGFYKTTAANNNAKFASGNSTDKQENGLNVTAAVTLDAANTSAVKIANASYIWAEGANTIGTSDGSGNLTFPDNSASAANVTLETNCYAGLFTIDVENLAPAAYSVLPIELLSFSAKKADDAVSIQWATISELNNDFFTIEHSRDGKDFEAIGKIQGAGNSNEVLSYEFMDKNPTFGINYYRLKQTDFDGAFEYFDPKTVEFKDNANAAIFPNPAIDYLTIQTATREKYTVQIFDSNGRLVHQSKPSEHRATDIDISTLVTGVYSIRIINSINQSMIFQDKLIKTNTP